MTEAEKTKLAERGLTGVRLSCQIVADHDMADPRDQPARRQRASRSRRTAGAGDHASAGLGCEELRIADCRLPITRDGVTCEQARCSRDARRRRGSRQLIVNRQSTIANSMPFSRRHFLAAAGGLALSTPLSAFRERLAAGAGAAPRPDDGYGDLQPDARRHDRAAAAGVAAGLHVSLVFLARRPAGRRPLDAWRARRHGGVHRAGRPRAADPESRNRRRPRRIWHCAGLRSAGRRRHDDARVRSRCRQAGEVVGEPVRYLAQLRGRPGSLGRVAHLRRDAARAAAGEQVLEAARLRLRSARRRRGHGGADRRHGPFRSRGGRRRPRDGDRLPDRGPHRLRLLPLRADDAGAAA